MKIAQVTPVYAPYRGGMGSVAEEYTERLRARGHEVDVFTPAYQKRLEARDSSLYYVHRVKPTLAYGNAAVLSGLSKDIKKFDVVHLHYPFYGTALPLVIARSIKILPPMVTTFHMDATASGPRGLFFNAHRHFLQKFILSRSSKILVSSFDYAKHSSLSKLDIRNSKFIEMPFGIDTQKFSPGESPVRARLGIPDYVPVMIFVGGLDDAHIFKGMPELLTSLPKLQTAWHLIVVGDGDLRPSFEALAKELGCRHNVHFVGSVGGDIADYYRAADIHVFPSTSLAEAFGLVALEAASTGIPSIASSLPGVRTVVKDGETGLLVSPRDVDGLTNAINRLLQDNHLREKLGRAARERVVKEYSWVVLMDKLEDEYRTVMNVK